MVRPCEVMRFLKTVMSWRIGGDVSLGREAMISSVVLVGRVDLEECGVLKALLCSDGGYARWVSRMNSSGIGTSN